ncbi:MAG: Rhs element Vgr protein, partial [Chitinophagaceae bacterium]
MAEARIIPAIQSVAEFVIKINGTEIPRTVARRMVHVNKTANKISYATIVIEDGEAATGTFPQSDGDLFVPGGKVEISAGDPDNKTLVFKGIIIKHSISIKNYLSPQLIIECRQQAVKLTKGRKSKCFHDMSDSDII